MACVPAPLGQEKVALGWHHLPSFSLNFRDFDLLVKNTSFVRLLVRTCYPFNFFWGMMIILKKQIKIENAHTNLNKLVLSTSHLKNSFKDFIVR